MTRNDQDDVPRQPNARKGRKRALVASGTLLGITALATSAYFTDIANLNLGNGTDGVGGNNSFDIKVVKTAEDGTPIPGQWQDADTAEGVDIKIPGADTITPGDTISVDIPFRNASAALSADITLSLGDVPGRTSDAEFAGQLRYTVRLDGTPILTAGEQTGAQDLDLGTLAAGEQGTVNVAITLLDQGTPAANNTLKGKTAHVQAHFDAQSSTP